MNSSYQIKLFSPINIANLLKKNKSFRLKNENPRILVAPLDWGLGHATRCIPIIRHLIQLDCSLYIVAEKKNFFLLKKEFPNAVFLRYWGYNIKYSSHPGFLLFKLFFQAPKIIRRIFSEKKWLKKIIKQHAIDIVISDNRFGMHNQEVPSIYITHQLNIKTGNLFLDKIAQNIHYYFIKKYTACWVPDCEDGGLAGELSHPKKIPGNTLYIGPLSRFNYLDSEKTFIYDLAIILSGPEPQRTLFENEILNQLSDAEETIIFIRGLPAENEAAKNFNSITIKNHLPANELNKIIRQSKMVISRSGYTTIMDLAALRKKAILIATPGQTEQEYLAQYLNEKRFFMSVNQNGFSIKKSIKKAESFPFGTFDFPKEKYKEVINELIAQLKSKK